ncbi:location of vulva defective 1-like [Dreissena polymorpha]|uniref:Uncharacterized protein n=1 Tax=Dreissena polymorpha TaxID=45954 RepID=A0A9D4K755_DREPO|nr:location of vulva defective 1-like [Dreissena polymorpha]KAH3834204.1 hypothetical protein DPMN_107523 [Dreissena polymorpha]
MWNFLKLILVFHQVSMVIGAGTMYLGLLTYYNNELITCCQEKSECLADKKFCNLTFEIKIFGLNDSLEIQTWRPGTVVTPEEAVGLVHIQQPVNYNFNEWMGNVSINVSVYNGTSVNSTTLIDSFKTMYMDDSPRWYFVNHTGLSETYNATVTLVVRYMCSDPETCGDCFSREKCTSDAPFTGPTFLPGGFNATTAPILARDNITTDTGNATNSWLNTDASSTVALNKTTDNQHDFSTLFSSTSTTTTIEELATSSLSSSTTSTPFPATYPSTTTETTPSTTTAAKTTTTAAAPTTETSTITIQVAPISTLPTTTSTSLTTSSSSSLTTTSSKTVTTKPNHTPSPTVSRLPISTSGGIRPTTVEETSTRIEKVSAVWPYILAGVLGALAIAALIIFMVYLRHKKELRNRQEIYNVNPKVLRNFEEFTENGTTGRADVPMETEQY